VDQLADLILERGSEAWMRVPQRVHRDTRQAVEVALAFAIPQPHPFAAHESDGEAGISIHYM